MPKELLSDEVLEDRLDKVMEVRREMLKISELHNKELDKPREMGAIDAKTSAQDKTKIKNLSKTYQKLRKIYRDFFENVDFSHYKKGNHSHPDYRELLRNRINYITYTLEGFTPDETDKLDILHRKIDEMIAVSKLINELDSAPALGFRSSQFSRDQHDLNLLKYIPPSEKNTESLTIALHLNRLKKDYLKIMTKIVEQFKAQQQVESRKAPVASSSPSPSSSSTSSSRLYRPTEERKDSHRSTRKGRSTLASAGLSIIQEEEPSDIEQVTPKPKK